MLPQNLKKFWNWTLNKDTGQRELWLEGVIAEESWWGDEYTPSIFKEELLSGEGPVLLHVNSPGGDCIAASQIYTMLMEYPFDVIVQIEGVAASAASVIAMAGTMVRMSPTALMMAHNPWTSAVGDAAEMQKAIAMLDEVKESIINAYEIKTGLSRAKISHIMDSETWMSAHKAKELGFCDEIMYEDGTGGDENGKPDFIFSSKLATRQLMNKLMASMPMVKGEMPTQAETPAPVKEHPPDDETAAESEKEATPEISVLEVSSLAEKDSITISADKVNASPVSVAPIQPVIILAAIPQEAPEKKELDHRVKAADLEKRLSLLK